MNIQQIREKYPQYENIDDEKLLNAFHAKYYSKMPKEEFYGKVGYNPQAQVLSEQQSIAQQQANLTPQEQFISSLMSGIAGANTAFGNTFHGALQPALESKYAPEKLRNASKNVAGERERIYEEEKALNPLSAMSGYGAAQVAKALPGVVAGGTGLLPFANAGHFARALGGGIGGAASGASEYINPGDSRALNALIGGGTGLLIPGAGASAGMGGIKGVKNTFNSYPAGKVAEKVMAGSGSAKTKFNKAFNSIWDKGHESGLENIGKPGINYNILRKDLPGKYRPSLEQFLENPTAELANKLQSDLGKRASALQAKEATSGLVSSEYDALARVLKAQSRIRSKIVSDLEKSSPGLGKTYTETLAGYGKEVGPYIDSNAIAKYESGDLGNRAFLKALGNEEAFMTKMGRKNYPELNVRKYLPYVLGGGLLTGASTKAYNLYQGLGGNND